MNLTAPHGSLKHRQQAVLFEPVLKAHWVVCEAISRLLSVHPPIFFFLLEAKSLQDPVHWQFVERFSKQTQQVTFD